jgi:polyribonucleotide nucleotidyltransferase
MLRCAAAGAVAVEVAPPRAGGVAARPGGRAAPGAWRRRCQCPPPRRELQLHGLRGLRVHGPPALGPGALLGCGRPRGGLAVRSRSLSTAVAEAALGGSRVVARAVSVLSGVELSVVEAVGALCDASVVARLGATVLHAACAVDARAARPGDGGGGFLPLTVHYRERAYASGQLPRTLARREAVLDSEVLAGRLVDRALRPLVEAGFCQPTQLVVTLHAFDGEHDPEVLAVNACSAALHLARVPWAGPVGAARVLGHRDGAGAGQLRLCVGAALGERRSAALQLTVAGLGGLRTVMLEGGAREEGEEALVAAVRAADAHVSCLVAAQRALRDELDRVRPAPERAWPLVRPSARLRELAALAAGAEAARFAGAANVTKREREAGQSRYWNIAMRNLGSALAADVASASDAGKASEASKASGASKASEVEAEAAGLALALAPAPAPSPETDDSDEALQQEAVHDVLRAALRDAMLDDGKRPDGRAEAELRPLDVGVGVLPDCVHGSALFGRGNTQVLVSVALGAPAMAAPVLLAREQPLGAPPRERRFFLSYAFPPYAVNRTGKVFGSNRRMVGHGTLAERALTPLLPRELVESDVGAASPASYPLTVSLGAETMGSDGSTSMATVCGASLALAHAGVPLRALAAGVSVGLYSDPANPARVRLPLDILGLEDHFGEMDFKVAGSRAGVTSLQLDIKRPFVSLAVLEAALERARAGRLEVLARMEAALSTAAPRRVKALPVLLPALALSAGQVRELTERQRRVQLEIEDASGASIGLRTSPEGRYEATVFAQTHQRAERCAALLKALPG